MLNVPVKMRASDSKTELLAVRVTPRIKEIAVQAAHGEGVDVSEWLRNLVVSELKKRGTLTTILMAPGLKEGEE